MLAPRTPTKSALLVYTYIWRICLTMKMTLRNTHRQHGRLRTIFFFSCFVHVTNSKFLRLDEVLAHAVADKLCPVRGARLGEHVGNVLFHRPDAQADRRRDLPAARIMYARGKIKRRAACRGAQRGSNR